MESVICLLNPKKECCLKLYQYIVLKLLTVNGPRSRMKGAPTPKDESFRHQDFTRRPFIFYLLLPVFTVLFCLLLHTLTKQNSRPFHARPFQYCFGGMAYGGEAEWGVINASNGFSFFFFLTYQKYKNQKMGFLSFIF